MNNDNNIEYQNLSNISVGSSNIDDAIPYVPAFIYNAYCCVKKKLLWIMHTTLCNKNLSLNVNYDFVKILDRGKLKFP